MVNLLLKSLTILPVLGIFSSAATAQVIPDQTLPNNTTVTPEGNIFRVEGGTQAGGNLFHSFQDFSIQTGSGVFFNNAVDIQNIISRVTGGNLSLIDGLIQANGAANLFLINPNGIIFGPNAQLNIGGSFVSSTANSLIFNDGQVFSAINPQNPPLLSVNVPIGLQFGSTPSAITNRSQAIGIGLDRNPAPTGLQVQPGQNITLVGGNINLEGGNLTAFGGTIELGTVNNGFWQLGNGTSFNSAASGQILLSENSQVTTNGLSGGAINLQSGKITLTNGSGLAANTLGDFDGQGINIQGFEVNIQNQAFVSASALQGRGAGGGININADKVTLTGTVPFQLVSQLLAFADPQQAESVTFDPLKPPDGLYSLSGGEGKAGNVTINANQLIVRNGAGILTTAFGPGRGGNITLNVQSAELSNGSLIVTGTVGAGDAGDLEINANQLRVIEGTSLSTTPNSATEEGAGGDVTVNADFVELSGTPAGALVPAGIFTATLGLGNAGNLTINARQLRVTDGAQVSSSASGAGEGGDLTVNATEIELSGIAPDGQFVTGLLTSSSLLTVQGQQGMASAGDLTVNTSRLVVRDGAQISAATGGEGTAGNLTINASESIEVIGIATNADPIVESVSFGVVGDGILPSAIDSNTSGEGNAGNLNLATNRLTIRDGAEVGVRGTRQGSAGNLNITANSIILDNQGAISASTVSGSLGNITLQTDTLELRGESRITTNSGTADGGNININTRTLIAVENSDITANAQQGRGGAVRINAEGVFGTEFRQQTTPKSDITATSELGAEFSGVVEINRPETDANSALAELPTTIIDPSTLVVAGCASFADSEFIVTGRGGLPPSPSDSLSSDAVIVDWIDAVIRPDLNPKSPRNNRQRSLEVTPDSTTRQTTLVEAQGWVVRPNGSVELVAVPPDTTPHRSGLQPVRCQGFLKSPPSNSPEG
ncbi:filamentous hemagglutinin N-terminal domain-containing protein [Capilliphycus salinus ALCB114379]|uniref:two-partner secretion domain-containing protein n=1 Tax=Capilliphycus salinus TaxID=2768948 RepID=UPI0039A608CD